MIPKLNPWFNDLIFSVLHTEQRKHRCILRFIFLKWKHHFIGNVIFGAKIGLYLQSFERDVIVGFVGRNRGDHSSTFFPWIS
jgi:hypothetical protein